MTELFDDGEPLRAPSPPSIGGLSEHDLYQAIVERLQELTVVVFDTDLRLVLAVGSAVNQSQWDESELVGRRPADLLDPPEAAVVEAHYRAVLAGETRQHEHPGIRVDGAAWSSTISPLRDAQGRIVGGMVLSRNVAERRRSEQELRRLEEESATIAEFERSLRERLEFLNEINQVLAGTTDRRDVMRAVTRAVVPRLGDWCAIHVFLRPDDPQPEVEVAHVDPNMVRYARRLLDRYPYDPGAERGVPNVVRTGEPEYIPEINEELLAGLEVGPEVAGVVRKLQLRAAITVPLVKRHRTIGAMQFVLSGEDRHFDAEDLPLAMALAGRVASSLDNHRLMEQHREVSQVLQRSLLPATIPAIPGMQSAVAYWAGSEGTEVGGDFYDLFAIDETRFGVLIGDVCGSGPRAAALTSLVRHNVRANAWRGDAPTVVLDRLNEAYRRTERSAFCTLIYTELRADPGRTSLTVANGGHPLPLVVPAEGPAVFMAPLGPLVGVFDRPTFRAETIELRPGDTIVFYTDGATDLPPPDMLSDEEILALISEAVRSTDSAQGATAQLSEALDRRRPFSARRDDVALLLLRAE